MAKRKREKESELIEQFEFVMGDRIDTKYLFVEKQFFTKNCIGKKGEIWWCANRKCYARLLYDIVEKKLSRLLSAKPHCDECVSNETKNVERFTNLLAIQQMKIAAMDLNTVTSGSLLTKSRDIFKDVMIK